MHFEFFIKISSVSTDHRETRSERASEKKVKFLMTFNTNVFPYSIHLFFFFPFPFSFFILRFHSRHDCCSPSYTFKVVPFSFRQTSTARRRRVKKPANMKCLWFLECFAVRVSLCTGEVLSLSTLLAGLYARVIVYNNIQLDFRTSARESF